MDDYNLSNQAKVHLVFFQLAVEHVARMSRILRQSRGNALLVGVGGTGKTTVTRFAAHMSGCKCFTVNVTQSYRLAHFREDLKQLYYQVRQQQA
jgi:dynein heavy chain, axonemal